MSLVVWLRLSQVGAMLSCMEDAIIGRVRQIIEGTGEQQQEVAKRIGLDPTKLTKSLNGSRRFTSLELALIAQLGGQTVDWLLTGRATRSWQFAYRLSVLEGARTDALESDVVRSIARYHDGLTALEMLPSSGTGLEVPAVDSSFVRSGNRLAAWANEHMETPLYGLETSALISRVEEAFGVDVLVSDLPEGYDGLSYADGDLKLIVLATTSRAARQRYTLAHELGHLLAGDADEHVIRENIDHTTGHIESRANVFAASFLAPRDEVKLAIEQNGLAPAEAAWGFGMSPEAFSWRLFNLKMIDELGRKHLATKSTGRIAEELGTTKEQLERDRLSQTARPPMRLLAGYINAFQRGQATLRPVASMLGWDIDDVYNLFATSEGESLIGNPEQP